MSEQQQDPEEKAWAAAMNALPGLATSFFSKFPAKDNHKLNLYADFLGFLVGCILTWTIQTNLGPFAAGSFDIAVNTVISQAVVWGVWLLFAVACVATTFIRSP